MHATHDRITYERMKTAYAQGGIQSQPLLVPESVAVSQKEADYAEQFPETFANLGFQIERAGPESLVVREIPALLRSEEHTSELQSRGHLVCRLLLEQKKY